MAEMLDETSALESTTVGIYRTAATVKGGRRFSFSALVVVGDRRGRVGFGYSKANQVPPAIEKAQKEAKRKMRWFPLLGRTLPHAVTGRFGACTVKLIPASPGTGVTAGAAVRAVMEMVGVRDCLTKCFGSTNPKNLVKAVMNGLEQLRSKELVQELRGVVIGATAVEEAIEKGQAFMTAGSPGAEKMAAPVNTVGQDARRGGKRGGPGGGRGGGRRGGRPSRGETAERGPEPAPGPAGGSEAPA